VSKEQEYGPFETFDEAINCLDELKSKGSESRGSEEEILIIIRPR
jgi:hypothetical protein